MLKIGETLSPPQEKKALHLQTASLPHPMPPLLTSAIHPLQLWSSESIISATSFLHCSAHCSHTWVGVLLELPALTLLFTYSLEPSQIKKKEVIPNARQLPYTFLVTCCTKVDAFLLWYQASLWQVSISLGTTLDGDFIPRTLTCPHCMYSYASRASLFLWQDSCLTFSLPPLLPQTRLDPFTSDCSYLTSLISFPPWI